MIYFEYMIQRHIQHTLQQAAREFGVVSVTGPRQSGKTTLVRSLFSNYEYINLENISDRNILQADPKGFLDQISTGLIIDEVQRYPEILSYIQVHIDEHFCPGKFILTGSQNLLVSEKIGQSLAGRVAVLTLFPLTIEELQTAGYREGNYQNAILKGFYPGLFDKKQTVRLFYTSYLQTYVERDVRSIKNIGDLSRFERFLQLLAGRIGQIINYHDLGNDVGVSYKTIESWLSVLEASYVVMRLQPYYRNFGKRLVKSPKVYFTDVGLAAHLLGIDSPEEMRSHFAMGLLFENMVVMDLYKQIQNRLSSSQLYFFRDNNRNEVDVVLDAGSTLTPIEVKAGATFNSDYLDGVTYFQNLHTENGPKHGPGYIVYTGDRETTIQDNHLINWKNLKEVVSE